MEIVGIILNLAQIIIISIITAALVYSIYNMNFSKKKTI
jgi:hypothetical protein